MSSENNNNNNNNLNLTDNQVCAIIHWSSILTAFPIVALIVLLASQNPVWRQHAVVIVNFYINAFIFCCVSLVLCLILIGIPMLMLGSFLWFVFTIVGGLKAINGEVWPYPLTILKILK